MLTSCIDTDREVLKHISDISLPKFFLLNKTFYYKICDDNFLERRLKKYRYISQYKKSNETWKSFYCRAIFSIHTMDKAFNVDYTQGNFDTQLQVLKRFRDLNLLFQSLEKGEISYVTLIFKLLILCYRMYCIIKMDFLN